jgi:hypothetical protein
MARLLVSTRRASRRFHTSMGKRSSAGTWARKARIGPGDGEVGNGPAPSSRLQRDRRGGVATAGSVTAARGSGRAIPGASGSSTDTRVPEPTRLAR